MRLFGRNSPATAEPDPDAIDPNLGVDPQNEPDPNAQVDPDANGDPGASGGPDDVIEFTLPEGVTLDDLYDPDGNALFQDAQGNACMEDGTIIPETRDLIENEPPEPKPKPAPPARKPTAFKSPHEDALLSEDELAEAMEEMSPKALAIMQTMMSRMTARSIAAERQQVIASREIGIDPEVFQGLQSRIARVQHLVPNDLKGTRRGAMTEVVLAALDEAFETDDLPGALAKIRGAQSSQEAAPRKPPTPNLVPPSARHTTPRGGSDIVRRVQKAGGPRDVANETFHRDGIEGDVVAVLQRERKRGY